MKRILIAVLIAFVGVSAIAGREFNNPGIERTRKDDFNATCKTKLKSVDSQLTALAMVTTNVVAQYNALAPNSIADANTKTFAQGSKAADKELAKAVDDLLKACKDLRESVNVLRKEVRGLTTPKEEAP